MPVFGCVCVCVFICMYTYKVFKMDQKGTD